MDQHAVIDLHGDLEGRYVIEEQRPDGALLIRRELTVDEMLAKRGARRLTAEEIPDWFHELPADDEG